MPREELNWHQRNVTQLEHQLLESIFACATPQAVEAAITYARFLSTVGVTPENYPLFLRVLDIDNHHVVDALVSDRDPSALLSGVQPNREIIGHIFGVLVRGARGGIHAKNLAVILGVLQVAYQSPSEGCRIYPLTVADVNALARHLDKERGQTDLVNGRILDILARLAEAVDPAGDAVARHAATLRNAFFDSGKRLQDVIPEALLVVGEKRTEVAPRRSIPVSAEDLAKASLVPSSSELYSIPAAAARSGDLPARQDSSEDPTKLT